MGFSCPLNFIGGLPEDLTRGLLVGNLLVGGLGVVAIVTVVFNSNDVIILYDNSNDNYIVYNNTSNSNSSV